MNSSTSSTAAPFCQGPVRATRRPSFVMPRGSWDTHAHVFGPVSRFPFDARRSYTPEDCTADQYSALLDTLGIEYGVVVQGGAHGQDNAAMLDAVGRSRRRLRGVAVIDSQRADQDIERMHRIGVRGARMSTVVGGGVGFEEIERLSAKLTSLGLGWHLMLHFGRAAELLDVEPILKRVQSPFVLDHLARITGQDGTGSDAFKAVIRLLDTGRCWIKLASLYRLSSEPWPHRDMLPMIHAVADLRPDRIIWGLNWPHPIHQGIMPNDGDLVDLIPQWVADSEVQEAMLVTNPRLLYGSPAHEKDE